MIGFSKRESIVIIIIGILMIVGGGVCFMYEFPKLDNIVYGSAIGFTGSTFILFGNDLYKALKEEK